MARVGFKKTFTSGTFSRQALLDTIRPYIASAGFNILINDTTLIDFIRADGTADDANDDLPHWALSIEDSYNNNIELCASAVYGAAYNDQDARTNRTEITSIWNLPDAPSFDVSVAFAADGFSGWWWIHGIKQDAGSDPELTFFAAGVTSRRYPTDMHQGLCARYGIIDAWGSWLPAYARDEYGDINSTPFVNIWSPFGEGGSFNGQRHPGSPMPRMAVPTFPNKGTGITACIMGEFNELLTITDGYEHEEVVVPGWIAMSIVYSQPYAVPAPASFDVL